MPGHPLPQQTTGKMNKNKQPDLSEYQRHLGQTIGDISRAWRYQMNQRLKPLGLNMSTRQVLIELQRQPDGLMQRDLARKLGIESPTLVRLLDLLEEKGWVRRVTSADDKRRKYAVLTPKAGEQIQIIETLSKEMRAVMLDGLSLQDIEESTRLLQRMRRNLQRD
jgi:MarR family transcriptional regulator for hemolysin